MAPLIKVIAFTASLLSLRLATALTNPSDFVLTAGFADPRSIFYDGVYYAFATNHNSSKTSSNTSEPNANVPVATSKSFSSGWTYSDIQVLPDAGIWTASPPQVWDPAVYSYNESHFVMYYAAIPKADPTKHCIGAATATAILGTYTPQPTALICDDSDTGYISPNPFVYNGLPYIVHKAGANSDASIRLQQLNSTGDGLVGEGIELIHETGSEYDTEGPAMTFNPNASGHPILLFVTGFYKDPTYKIQYAVAPTNSLIPPQGKKYIVNSTPLMSAYHPVNGLNVYGPGGPCFPKLATSPQQMTFMADKSNTTYVGRSMRTANVTYGSDNTLSIE